MSVLHLTQGPLVVSDVIVESIAWESGLDHDLSPPLKGVGSDTAMSHRKFCDHGIDGVDNTQRIIAVLRELRSNRLFSHDIGEKGGGGGALVVWATIGSPLGGLAPRIIYS